MNNELDPITQWVIDVLFGTLREVLDFLGVLFTAIFNPFGV